jgi:hypothetical protein
MHEQAVIIMPLPMSTGNSSDRRAPVDPCEERIQSMETFASQIDSVRQV